jgi:tetratricopeptide (TPR) repeat protein
LPYKILSEKFREYKDSGHINDAIESCRMRSHINLNLHDDEADTESQADLCQIYLDRKQWLLAQEFASKALEYTNPLHAQSIKFYCILMQAFYMDDKINEADICFTKALEILDHHWGPFHPLHINIYSIMAQLLIYKNKYEDAGYLYKASLLCCMRILGPNHIQTGEVHMDYGKLYLLRKKKMDSLQHFMEAYLIYEAYFG